MKKTLLHLSMRNTLDRGPRAFPSLFLKRVASVSAITLAILAPSVISAKHITPDQALERIRQKTYTRASSEAEVVGNIVNATRAGSLPTATVGDLYVFSASDSFVILPADDQAPEILAYSANSGFSNNINPELAYWLDFYNRQLEYLAANPEASATRAEADRPDRAPIAPLTKTRWNQSDPYNDLCPEVDGKRTVTGCVATAMAQIMKYYSYPAKGKGEHSYEWKTGGKTLSFNFGATTFEWDKMTDTYDSNSSAEAKQAVANLMLACGISADMDYGVDESTAANINLPTALLEYYEYDKGLWMPLRDYYGLYEWEDMIYQELKGNHPVLYSGQGTGGGHQFICDGYSEDGFFHFNWGWGGMSDGYFLLTALNPASLGVGGGAGGFNSDQQIILGVKPPVANSSYTYILYCTENFVPAVTQVSAEQNLKFDCLFYNFSITALPKDSKAGVKIINTATNQITYADGMDLSDLPPYRGYDGLTVKFPSLSDGTYILSPAFYDGKVWIDMGTPVGYVDYCQAVIKGGVATLSSPEAASITITDIELPSTIYNKRQFPLEFTVVNNTSIEYIGKVTPVLIDPSTNEAVAASVYRPVDVEADSKLEVEDYIGLFEPKEDQVIETGKEYILVFQDEAGKAVSENLKVTLATAPATTTISVSDFKLDGKSPVTDKSEVKFKFTVTCQAGYFTDRLRIVVFPYIVGSYVSDVASKSTDMLYLSAGESEEESVEMDLSSLDDGEYFAIVYLGSKDYSSEVVFSLDKDSGVSIIGFDNDEPKEIFDLNGVRHEAPLKPGIYIINGVKTLIK